MIIIPGREDGGGHQFPFRHPTYLVCSNRVGEILHLVQDDSGFIAGSV
jgi:hypothetical protein